MPEYPRPQMVRDKWTNLNGLWQYAIRPKGEPRPENWDGEILVPFCVESALSGVKKAVKPDERLWYRRTFSSSALAGQKELLLHFGAVDWECTAWVNGKEVGHHTGGYDPFTFDITEALKSGDSENELVVAVTDPTDTGTQPRGKQVLNPKGFFTQRSRVSGRRCGWSLCRSTYIRSLKVTPNVDRVRWRLRWRRRRLGPRGFEPGWRQNCNLDECRPKECLRDCAARSQTYGRLKTRISTT